MGSEVSLIRTAAFAEPGSPLTLHFRETGGCQNVALRLLSRGRMILDTVLRWSVLVVDDHVASRQALMAAIAHAGGRVVAESDSARAAAKLVAEFRPDVAIVAAGLFDGDGIIAAASVQARTPCPVVLLTGHADAEIIERAAVAGVTSLLLKPLRADEVAPALDRACARFKESSGPLQHLDARKGTECPRGLALARQELTEDVAARKLRDAATHPQHPLRDLPAAVLVAAPIVPEEAELVSR
jgi:AmiR/NasT family two-component response regulator